MKEEKMTKDTTSNKTINIIGGIALVALLLFGAVTLLKPVPVPKATGVLALDTASSATAIEAKIVNGVQEVTLGWGKFNYAPEAITVKKGMPVRITADIQRLSGCFRSFQIPELGVSKQFTDSDNIVEFTPQKAGTFTFSCAMGMGSGKLQVV
ncbi:hypothetical protein C4580_00945 [Candidatus Woesearchaeota archaeon]|nr:MAG: hypothetical protein C4580_00945 [Candidatus Woesearchaeota archaeon]